MNDDYPTIEINGVKCQLREGDYYSGSGVTTNIPGGMRYVWANKFVHCNNCDQGIGLIFKNDRDMDAVTDQMFIDYFTEKGWVYEPGEFTYCPKCAKKIAKRLSKRTKVH